MNGRLLAVATAVGLGAMLSAAEAEAAFVPSPDSPFGGQANGSLVIKFAYDNEKDALKAPEINLALFPSITGKEFSFLDTGKDYDGGSWTYKPTGLDPLITAFSVKAGLGSSSYTGSGTFGSWKTPAGKDLSYIAFYHPVVPLPAAFPLLGTGLLALWGLGRMRRQPRRQALA